MGNSPLQIRARPLVWHPHGRQLVTGIHLLPEPHVTSLSDSAKREKVRTTIRLIVEPELDSRAEV